MYFRELVSVLKVISSINTYNHILTVPALSQSAGDHAIEQDIQLSAFSFFPVQVRSRTGVHGTAVTGALHAQTSWRAIIGSTQAPNPSSVSSAHAPFPDPTTSPCTWRDTRTSSILTHTCTHKVYKNTSTTLTCKSLTLSPTTPMLWAVWSFNDTTAPPGAAIMC